MTATASTKKPKAVIRGFADVETGTKPPRGWRNPSLATLDDLKACCYVLDGHWIWTRGLSGLGKPQAVINGHGVVGSMITAHLAGRADERPAGMRWMQACANPLCLAPECLRVVTHQRVMQLAAKAGRLKRSPVHRLKQLERIRNDPRVYPEWMVEWAIESPQNARDIAHALGVSWTTAKSWRNGTTRIDRGAGPISNPSPFVHLIALAAAR